MSRSINELSVGGELERPLGPDRRGGADALALAGDRHHRGLSLDIPGRAAYRIGQKVHRATRALDKTRTA